MPDSTTQPGRRRSGGRRLLRRFLLAAAIGVAAAALAVNFDLILGDPEQRHISAERAKRRAMWAMGQTLSGTPDLARLDERLQTSGFTLQQPILMRVFKREFELEIWKLKSGRYEKFTTYPICRWSGRLGPKLEQGDHQAPEGFYTVGRHQLNPNSRWHRSFNLGFPNLYDRAHGRTGSFLMVHGGCGSVGCYAMTDAAVDEIWRIVTAALEAGQRRFQVQAFPFRMSEQNMAGREDDPNYGFWRSLKEGSDLFEATGLPPRVEVCDGAYRFSPGNADARRAASLLTACPSSHTQGRS